MSLWGQRAKPHLYKNESCMSRERSAYRRSANLQVSTATFFKTKQNDILSTQHYRQRLCIAEARWLMGLFKPKTDVTPAILSRDFVARVRDSATLSRKQTRLLHHLSRFTIFIHKHSSKVMKLFHM